MAPFFHFFLPDLQISRLIHFGVRSGRHYQRYCYCYYSIFVFYI